jgi:predicted dehydrogenase
VVTQYEVAGGAIVHAEGSWAMSPGFGFNMSFTVNFEKATVDYDSARDAEALKVFEDGKGRVVKLEGPDGYAGEAAHLVEQIQKGAAPVVTAEDGLRALEICEAEERSIKSRVLERVIYGAA